MDNESEDVRDEDRQGNQSDSRKDDKTLPKEGYILMFLHHLAWVFAPFRPFYNSIKSSSAFANDLFSAMENIACQFIEYITNIDLKSPKRDADEIPGQSLIQRDANSSIDSVIKQLYKIWLQSHRNLFVTVDYLANLYEEIVPLLPGDVPWDNSDKGYMSIRERCFYATRDMGYRLCIHTKIFLQHAFTFFSDIVSA